MSKDKIAELEAELKRLKSEDEEGEDSSVEVERIAENIAEKLSAKIIEATGHTASDKDVEEAKTKIFGKSSDGSDRGKLSMHRLTLDDFTLDNLPEIKDAFGKEVARVGYGAQARDMKLADAATIVTFYKGLLHNDEATVKALSEGTDAEGGHLVPEEFRAEVVKTMLDFSVMRRLARTFTMRSKTLELPTLAARPRAYWSTENVSDSTTSARFGNVLLTASRLTTLLYTSRELQQDSMVDLAQFITELFAEEIARKEDYGFFTGSGSGQPQGLNGQISSTVTGNITYDNLVSVMTAVPQAHRAVGSWVGNINAVRDLYKLTDDQSRPIFGQGDVSQGRPDTILGRPFYEMNALADGTIIYGDYRYYFIGDRQQLTVETTTEGGDAWNKHQLSIKAVTRVDGRVAKTNVFKKLAKS